MRGAVREEEEEEEVLGMWAGALSCDASGEREWMRVGGGTGWEGTGKRLQCEGKVDVRGARGSPTVLASLAVARPLTRQRLGRGPKGA